MVEGSSSWLKAWLKGGVFVCMFECMYSMCIFVCVHVCVCVVDLGASSAAYQPGHVGLSILFSPFPLALPFPFILLRYTTLCLHPIKLVQDFKRKLVVSKRSFRVMASRLVDFLRHLASPPIAFFSSNWPVESAIEVFPNFPTLQLLG